MLGDIYPACVTAALTLCLKRNKAGYVGRAAFAWPLLPRKRNNEFSSLFLS